MHSLAHGRALAEVCVVAVAGSFEGGIKKLRAGMCWLPLQTSNSSNIPGFPPASLRPLCFQQLLFFFFFLFFSPFLASDFSPSLVFPSFAPPEALLGRALEKERESGSVGQLRQQARAGCSRCATGALLLLQRFPAHSNFSTSPILVSFPFFICSF